jgi:hypothetical protein
VGVISSVLEGKRRRRERGEASAGKPTHRSFPLEISGSKYSEVQEWLEA